MPNKILYEKRTVAHGLEIEIDRILIFVESIAEIEAWRKLNFFYFEVTNRNLQQGTISHIFFLNNFALELIRVENYELANRYAAKTNLNIVARTQWQSNQAIPFGFILRYATSQQPESRRRRYAPSQQGINNHQAFSQVNFSSKNFKELQEPACYIVPASLTCKNMLDNVSTLKQRLLFHQSGTSKLTNITITLNTSKPLTNTVYLISALNLINIKQGDDPKLELELDHRCQRKFLPIFPTIPMTIAY